MSKGWDNAMIKRLKALTGKGLSTAEIGKKLGLSKNAVVGKLNRLGWNLKASGGASTETTKKKPSAETAKKKTATVKKTGTVAVAKNTKKTAVAATTSKSKTVKSGAKADTTTQKKVAAKGTKTTPKKTAEPVKQEKAKDSAKSDKKNLNKSLAMHQRIIQHSLEMANLKPNQCRWPIGDPDSENFHFCGETVFVGKPYCYEHCKQAYQFTPPKKK